MNTGGTGLNGVGRGLADSSYVGLRDSVRASVGTNLAGFLATLTAGTLYEYRLLDATSGVLVDIYSGKA